MSTIMPMERPAYNHTREDGPDSPCPLCAHVVIDDAREALVSICRMIIAQHEILLSLHIPPPGSTMSFNGNGLDVMIRNVTCPNYESLRMFMMHASGFAGMGPATQRHDEDQIVERAFEILARLSQVVRG